MGRAGIPNLVAFALLVLSACTGIRDQVDSSFVRPVTVEIAGPELLGLAAERVTIPVAGGELDGLFLPAGQPGAPIVVLCHGNHVNVSMLHPWYSFLHAAGCEVLAFDPRGFGRSPGPATLRAWQYDMRDVLDWLRARPGVDPARIVLFGTGVGSLAALHAAARFGPVGAVIVENVSSPRDHIRDHHGDGFAAAIHTGLVEFGGVPENLEPDENAARLLVPSLWLGGTDEIGLDRRTLLRAFAAAPEPKQLWLLPDTAASPHPMLTHDGEYQDAVAAFVTGVQRGWPRVQVEWRRGPAGEGGTWIDVTLQRVDAPADEPWAVQICATDRDASSSFHRVWLEGARSSHRIRVAGDPALVTAVRIRRALGDESGSGWVPQRSELTRAGRMHQRLRDDLDVLRNGEPSLDEVRRIAERIHAADREMPFPPVLAAEIADALAVLGRRLANSRDAEDRARGMDWLRRAIAAAPARPELHFWPGNPATFGFQHEEAVRATRALLTRLEGR